MGINAYPLLAGNYNGNFFGYNTDLKYLKEVKSGLSKNDIVVVPEYLALIKDQFLPARSFLFVQNYPHLYPDHAELAGKSYVEFGYEQVLYCSTFLKTKLNREPPENIWHIPNFIDLARFKPDESKRITGRVLAMRRKVPEGLKTIRTLLKHRGIELVVVDGLNESQLIDEYQKSDIFVTVSRVEGFGLPPLEAMACGCVVAGFTGGGASEYMIDQQTALVADDSDYEGLAEAVLELLNNPHLKEKLRIKSQLMSKRYNEKNSAAKLIQFYQSTANHSN
jgi:glycosyltransferase involved in cell wall biosynthesis